MILLTIILIQKDIEKIKNYLQNGDVYQINYTTHKSFASHNIDTYDLYKKLRYEIKPKEGFYMHSDDFDILSFSPELFLKIKDQKISTFPIKKLLDQALMIIFKILYIN